MLCPLCRGFPTGPLVRGGGGGPRPRKKDKKKHTRRSFFSFCARFLVDLCSKFRSLFSRIQGHSVILPFLSLTLSRTLPLFLKGTRGWTCGSHVTIKRTRCSLFIAEQNKVKLSKPRCPRNYSRARRASDRHVPCPCASHLCRAHVLLGPKVPSNFRWTYLEFSGRCALQASGHGSLLMGALAVEQILAERTV